MLQLDLGDLDYLISEISQSTNQPPRELLIKLQEERKRVAEYSANMSSGDACSFEIIFKKHDVINAIKLYRSITGAGLREAHDFINRLVLYSQPIVINGNRVTYDNALGLVKKYINLDIKMC